MEAYMKALDIWETMEEVCANKARRCCWRHLASQALWECEEQQQDVFQEMILLLMLKRLRLKIRSWALIETDRINGSIEIEPYKNYL